MVQRGEAHRREKAYRKARRCFETARRRSPDHPAANRHLGILALEEHEAAEAYEHFQRNIIAGTAEVQEYCYAALAALALKKGGEALHILAQLEEVGRNLDPRVRDLIREYRDRASRMIRPTKAHRGPSLSRV